jgi:hypothetical protein
MQTNAILVYSGVKTRSTRVGLKGFPGASADLATCSRRC